MGTGTKHTKRSSTNGKKNTGLNQRIAYKLRGSDLQTCADFENAIQSVFQYSLGDCLTLSDLRNICAKNKQQPNRWLWIVIPVLCAFVISSLGGRDFITHISKDIKRSVSQMDCLLEQNGFSAEVTRPIFDCNRCTNLKAVPVDTNISKEYFENTYAYTGIPVVIRNSTGNWTAHDVFSVQYFEGLYTEDENSIKTAINYCQFFPFYTGWENLVQGLYLMNKQTNLTSLYIGWSNCVDKVEDELRKHYQKPNFLPQGGDDQHGNWIFMGGSGHGAPPHIDHVGRPSWQAQIRGRKTWYLDPPAECDHVCQSLTVDMDVGDIIALDTDVWYHSTYIHPGEISITIGCEFD